MSVARPSFQIARSSPEQPISSHGLASLVYIQPSLGPVRDVSSGGLEVNGAIDAALSKVQDTWLGFTTLLFYELA